MSEELPEEETEEVEATDEEIAEALSEMIQISSGDETLVPGEFCYFGKGTRSVMILGELTEESCTAVISQILEITKEDDEDAEPLQVFLNTYGGSTIAALAVYDVLRCLPCEVVVIVMGACFSAGLILLSAGDIRLAHKHSVLLYHEPIIVSDGGLDTRLSMQSLKGFYDWNLRKIEKLIRKRAKISKKVWKSKFRGHTSKYIDTDQALKYNLLDGVIKEFVK